MATDLFSTYSTSENRVTASTLAVLKSLSLDRIQRLIAAMLEQPEFELIRFQNQPSKGSAGIPDGMISSSVRILLETKIKRNAVRTEQLKRHLARLDGVSEAVRLLLVLTPDERCPPEIEAFNDPRLVWTSFAALDQAIDELLIDSREVVSEREAFLLRELQAMFTREQLVSCANEVVIVPARHAWPEYQNYHAYVCQPDRYFQPVSRIGFYTLGRIHPVIPRILETHPTVEFGGGLHKGALGSLVDLLLNDPNSQVEEGQPYKVMLLSAPDDADTLKLDAPIANDMKSKNGRTTAFTQNQRYVSLDRLRSARTTSELVAD